MTVFYSVDSYIASFPERTQQVLKEVRAMIRSLAPEADEKMAYGIPTFTLNGNLVHYGAYEHHIGFYPGAEGIEKFKHEFVDYKYARGSVQFPLDHPMPMDLIRRITLFRVEQNRTKSSKKL